MTVGRRQYNEGEMRQMQREAEMRVREMQKRAEQTLARAQQDLPNTSESPEPHGWHSDPGTPPTQDARQQPNPTKPESSPQEPLHTPKQAPAAPPQGETPAKKSGTIVGDIMDALGLDEDYLLIIGLILILINQRADTTLILALVYLLI